MPYRGRLIAPFIAIIHRLDVSATELAGGFDPDFRSIKHGYPGGLGTRVSARRELPPIELTCQVEMGRWDEQRQVASGNAPNTELTLIFHFTQLEAAGLVDLTTGDPLLRVNDRLSELRRIADSTLVQAVRDPPGLYATEVQPAGLGLGGNRNLLVTMWGDRPQGLTT